MRLIQFLDIAGNRRVGVVESVDTVVMLAGTHTVYALAQYAIQEQASLANVVTAHTMESCVDYDSLIAEGHVLLPVDHPDPAHLLVTGTGLTHLGSADARDRMHKAEAETMTDSMRMFQLGLEGGKPAPGEVGVQPEWFYKGDGRWVAAPYKPLISPFFALDGGEEPEIAGLYVVGPNGTPYRLGFALGNEFSDHVMERQNYLYLAHSKLRPCSLGPELLLGDLPTDVRGMSRVLRTGADGRVRVIWEKPFLSGEDNMSHTIANLEYHQFKYAQFRHPGDVHVHFFGTATLSFADGIRLEPGDEIEIEAADFGRPLRNRVNIQKEENININML